MLFATDRSADVTRARLYGAIGFAVTILFAAATPASGQSCEATNVSCASGQISL